MNCPQCGWKLVGDFKVYAEKMEELRRTREALRELVNDAYMGTAESDAANALAKLKDLEEQE